LERDTGRGGGVQQRSILQAGGNGHHPGGLQQPHVPGAGHQAQRGKVTGAVHAAGDDPVAALPAAVEVGAARAGHRRVRAHAGHRLLAGIRFDRHGRTWSRIQFNPSGGAS